METSKHDTFPPISRLRPGETIMGELLAVEKDGMGGQTITVRFWTGPARYILPEEVLLPPVGKIVDIFCIDGAYSVRELA